MGASSWWYEVEYQEDVAAALADLRNEVFAKGDFSHPWKPRIWAPDAEETEEMIEDAAGPDASAEELRAAATALKKGKRPASIDHLLALAAEDGTHSILDMVGIGDGFGHVAALEQSDYERMFATGTPSLKQVKAKKQELMDHRGRWMGTYIVAYRDGVPSKILFTGFSGD